MINNQENKEAPNYRRKFLQGVGAIGIGAGVGLVARALIGDSSNTSPEDPTKAERTPQEVADLFDKVFTDLSKDPSIEKIEMQGHQTELYLSIHEDKFTFQKYPDERARTFQIYDGLTSDNIFYHIYPDRVERSVIQYLEHRGPTLTQEGGLLTPPTIAELYSNIVRVSKRQPVKIIPPSALVNTF